jgi:SAM-dependent methyltransferase
MHHSSRMGHGLTETCGFVKADFMKMPFEVRPLLLLPLAFCFLERERRERKEAARRARKKRNAPNAPLIQTPPNSSHPPNAPRSIHISKNIIQKTTTQNKTRQDDAFDAVYQIEATCHAPDQVGCYREILRVLKPGALFAGYEWCGTDKFDRSNPEHAKIIAEIELGNGLPDTRTTAETRRALEAAGFEVLEAEDLSLTADIPWYDPVDPDVRRLSNFRTTRLGRAVTNVLVRGLEAVGVAPKGTLEVSSMLGRAADGLVAGGKMGIYTPMYYFLVRKPVAAPSGKK